MKRIVIVALAVMAVLMLATAEAAAATHTVRKGECLSKIAAPYHIAWRKLWQANKSTVKNPDRIYPGQKLIIPAVVQSQITQSRVRGLGAHAFGNRSFKKAIMKFNLPEQVKKDLIAKVESDDFVWAYLKKGDARKQMIFDNFKMLNNALMDWAEGHLEAVMRYTVESGDEIIHLEKPLKCYNWCWWPEKKPKEEIKPPTEQPAIMKPSPPPKQEAKKQYYNLLIPPPVILVVGEVPRQEAKATERGIYCKPDNDTTVGVFADRHRSGNNPRGFWFVSNTYFCDILDEDCVHSVGFAVEGNYWNGTTGDLYNYYGERFAVDGSYRRLTENTELQIRAGLGKVYDWGNIDTNPGRYESDQVSKIATAYAGYEIKSDRKYFSRMRYSAQVDWDYSRSKADQWVDPSGKEYPLNGEASSKTMVSVGVDGSIYKFNDTVSLAGGASAIYYQEGNKGLRVSPGLDFYGAQGQMLVAGARVNPTLWSGGDHAIGIGAFLDLTNLARVIFPDWFTGRTFASTWKEEKVDQEKQEELINNILK